MKRLAPTLLATPLLACASDGTAPDDPLRPEPEIRADLDAAGGDVDATVPRSVLRELDALVPSLAPGQTLCRLRPAALPGGRATRSQQERTAAVYEVWTRPADGSEGGGQTFFVTKRVGSWVVVGMTRWDT